MSLASWDFSMIDTIEELIKVLLRSGVIFGELILFLTSSKLNLVISLNTVLIIRLYILICVYRSLNIVQFVSFYVCFKVH